MQATLNLPVARGLASETNVWICRCKNDKRKMKMLNLVKHELVNKVNLSNKCACACVCETLSLMCSLQFQLGSCDFLFTHHTRWQGAEWGQTGKDGKERSTYQSFCFAPGLIISNQGLALLT
jgi:hypothetical protein